MPLPYSYTRTGKIWTSWKRKGSHYKTSKRTSNHRKPPTKGWLFSLARSVETHTRIATCDTRAILTRDTRSLVFYEGPSRKGTFYVR